jgi:hypothetical protein
VRLSGLGKLKKKCIHFIGSRTRDLSARNLKYEASVLGVVNKSLILFGFLSRRSVS